MDQIFDRLGNLLKSLFEDDREERPFRSGTSSPSGDPDMREAWEELDEFLKSGKEGGGAAKAQARAGQRYRPSQGRPASGPSVPEELRTDFGNLEVPFGASDDEVRKSYKRLIRQYHPDRHASDPKKLAYATQITQKINQSYQRITKWRETGRI